MVARFGSATAGVFVILGELSFDAGASAGSRVTVRPDCATGRAFLFSSRPLPPFVETGTRGGSMGAVTLRFTTGAAFAVSTGLLPSSFGSGGHQGSTLALRTGASASFTQVGL